MKLKSIGPRGCSLLLSILGLLLSSSCVPTEVNQTIICLGDIVNEAGLLVSTADKLDSRRSQENKLAALKLAEAASRASWLALSEADSKDSVSKKNEKIAKYLSKVTIPRLHGTSDLQLQMQEDGLIQAVRTLQAQLDENARMLFVHPEIGDLVPHSLPFMIVRRLNQIRDKASENITIANLLLESLD